MPYDPFTGQYRPSVTPPNTTQGATGQAPPATGFNAQVQGIVNDFNSGSKKAAAATRYNLRRFNNPIEGGKSFGSRLGSATQTGADFIAKQGFNPLLAGGLAGLGSALSGGGIAEVIGSGSGGAGAAALAGRLAVPLSAMGTWGKLGAAAISIAAPMAGAALGGGIGRGLDNGPLAAVGSAMQQGGQANINRTLNPTNSLSAIIDNSLGGMSKQSREYADLARRMGYDSQDVAAYGVQKVAIPLLNHQANLRAKMLPLDTAARMAQQTNQNIGQMFNTSIAGTSNIAAQIAANNPYGQVMI